MVGDNLGDMVGDVIFSLDSVGITAKMSLLGTFVEGAIEVVAEAIVAAAMVSV